MAKTKFTFESNLEKVTAKIKEKPQKVLNIIGQNIVRETKVNIKSSDSRRRGMLISSLGYWARRIEGDLQIGFNMSIDKNKYGAGPGIVGDMLTGVEKDPILPVVIKNKEMIVSLIAQALDEIRKE